MKELESLIESIQVIEYKGAGSINRLIFLNKLSHEVILKRIIQLSKISGEAFEEERKRHNSKFLLNANSLTCLIHLLPQRGVACFGKIKQRLLAEILFYRDWEPNPHRDLTIYFPQ